MSENCRICGGYIPEYLRTRPLDTHPSLQYCVNELQGNLEQRDIQIAMLTDKIGYRELEAQLAAANSRADAAERVVEAVRLSDTERQELTKIGFATLAQNEYGKIQTLFEHNAIVSLNFMYGLFFRLDEALKAYEQAQVGQEGRQNER